jgi:hypothetical protein
VLACASCNRGGSGKFAKLPELRLLERLATRNDFLIESHHPLRETLMAQTGATAAERTDTLQVMDNFAREHLVHRWAPSLEHEPAF